PAEELFSRLLVNEPLPELAEARAARDALWIALTELVVELARRSPLVLGVEDAQWADVESLSCRDHVRVELRPLARRSVRAIAAAILREKVTGAAGEAIAETIAVQAGGSPLFAEELARLTAQGRDASSAPTIESAMQVQI